MNYIIALILFLNVVYLVLRLRALRRDFKALPVNEPRADDDDDARERLQAADSRRALAASVKPIISTPPCDHGLTFDQAAAKHLSVPEVRARWPRLFGKCPKGCGFDGIAYASREHYYYGDW